MNARLVFIQALSPIHCGTGQAAGGIDLPIARERPTNIPFIPGSSFKGVLRASAPDGKLPLHLKVFGPETDTAHEYAGGVQFSDLHLIALPVRSVRGTFAYATSAYMLRRLQRDLAETGRALPKLGKLPASTKTAVVTGDRLQVGKRVVFEDLAFDAEVDTSLEQFSKKLGGLFLLEDESADFTQRFCVLHDDAMALLLETGTEIIARNRLDEETKTVSSGALWTEEALPVESILCGLIVATPVKTNGRSETARELLDHVEGLAKGAIQIGGKSTVGRGLCRVKVVSHDNA